MAAKRPGRSDSRPKPSKSSIPIVALILGGGTLALLFGGVALFVGLKFLPPSTPPVHEEPPPPVPIPIPAPPTMVKNGPWWDDVPESKLADTFAKLKPAFTREQPVFTSLGDRTEAARLKAYQDFVAKLPALLSDQKARDLLARFVIDCYAFEPVDKNLTPLRDWLVSQIPAQNAEYPAGYKNDHLDAALWAIDVSSQALIHPKTKPNPVSDLAQDLGKALGFSIDPTLPLPELKARAEKLLALRCYNNLLPTAAKSAELALTIRDALIKKFAAYLSPTFRERIDIELAAQCFPDAARFWPAYTALLSNCLESENASTKLEIVSLYEQADKETASKLEPVLATKWKECADAALTQEGKVRAMHRALGTLNPLDRLTRLETLTHETLARPKAKANESLPLLEESLRLAHASTLACALLRREFGLGRFDQLIAKVPELDSGEPKPIAKNDKTKDPDPQKKEVAPKVEVAGPPLMQMQKGILTPANGRYPQRGAFFNVHPAPLKAGRTYDILMLSGFDNYLFLESPNRQVLMSDDDGGGGLNARIVFTAPLDGQYRVIATAFSSGATGPYSLTIQEVAAFARPGMPPPFFPGKRPPLFNPFGGRMPPPFPPPVMMPQQPIVIPGQPHPPDEKPKPEVPAGPAPQLDDADVKGLKENIAKNRVNAFHELTEKLTGDLTQRDIDHRHARDIARYLVIKASEAEIGQVAIRLPRVAKSRNLILALAYFVDLPAANQVPSEAVVGALLEQKLRFGKNDWQPACRKLLLLQAIDLSGKNAIGQATELMRDYYLEQGVLLGMNVPDVPPLTRPSQVMERLIRHIATKIEKDKPAKEHKEYLDQLPRHLLVARSTAQNDLEYTVMLQRVWFNVLTIHLERQRPQRAKDLQQVQLELNDLDRRSNNVLEQLRAGEEKVLKLWGLALDLK